MSKNKYKKDQGPSARWSVRLIARIIEACSHGTKTGFGQYEIPKAQADRITDVAGKSLPREGAEITLIASTHTAAPGKKKRDPGVWMLGKENSKYILTFVFEDW